MFREGNLETGSFDINDNPFENIEIADYPKVDSKELKGPEVNFYSPKDIGSEHEIFDINKEMFADDFKDVNAVPDSPEGYHRPYLREDVREEIYNNAPKNEKGQYLDANTGLPIEGKPDIGHKQGHEFWRETQKAYNDKLTQAEFNDRMNNPDLYQLEDMHNNRSHKYEDHSL